MPDAPITCPYCNAQLETPKSPSPGSAISSNRVVCPRCGESAPLPISLGVSANDPVPAETSANIDAEVERHRRSRQGRALRSLRATLLLGVCLGALGLLAGLGISWFKQKTPAEQLHAPTETAHRVAPAQMPGLGYLPEGTDSVFALELRPLIDARAPGEPKDARSMLLGFGVPPELADGLDRAVGVGLDQIDQAVIGLKLRDGSLLRQVVLVVHTRESFSIDALAGKLKANAFTRDGRLFYNFRPSPKLPVEVHCWAPSDRVLVAGLDAEYLKAIPAEGREGLGHLAPRTAEIIKNQIAADTCFWAVLDSDKWEDISTVVLTLGAKRPDLVAEASKIMASLHTAVMTLRLDSPPSLQAWFDAKSEAIAGEWRSWLQAKFKDDSAKVAVGGAGNRVMLRTAAHGGAIRSLVEALVPKK